MNTKKIISMVTASVMALSIAAFSGGVGTIASAKTKAATKTTINIWTLHTKSNADANTNAFLEALEMAKKDLPDINIVHDATENEAYKTKIKTAIAANEAPDVFFSWGAGFLKPFVDAGKVLPLDSYLNDGTSKRMQPGTSSFFTFNNKTYGLTSYQWLGVLYCNKALFDKYKVKVPDTYQQLLTAVKTFRANNVTPITVGEKDRWPGMFFQNAFALKAGGAKLSVDALSGKASFDQPAFVTSAQKLKELVDAKAFDPGCLALASSDAEAPFLAGQIPMYYMGNWFASSIESQKSDLKNNIVAKNFPTLEGGKGTAGDFLGGSIDGLCVSAQTKNKVAAVRVAKYIAETMAKIESRDGTGLPTWKVPGPKGKVGPVSAQITKLASSAKGFVLAWDTFLAGASADTHKDLVAKIFGGQIAPQDFAKEMQKLSR